VVYLGLEAGGFLGILDEVLKGVGGQVDAQLLPDLIEVDGLVAVVPVLFVLVLVRHLEDEAHSIIPILYN
jgi:hypothetical protein